MRPPGDDHVPAVPRRQQVDVRDEHRDSGAVALGEGEVRRLVWHVDQTPVPREVDETAATPVAYGDPLQRNVQLGGLRGRCDVAQEDILEETLRRRHQEKRRPQWLVEHVHVAAVVRYARRGHLREILHVLAIVFVRDDDGVLPVRRYAHETHVPVGPAPRRLAAEFVAVVDDEDDALVERGEQLALRRRVDADEGVDVAEADVVGVRRVEVAREPKINKIHLLCGNFAVGLYTYIHTKINNSIPYHINVQW